MQDLAPGANATLAMLSTDIVVRHALISGADIDISAFLLANSGKVRSDADMCFYGQPEVEKGALVFAGAGAGVSRFHIDLGRFPAEVEKLVLTATIHENRASFNKIPSVEIEIGDLLCRIPCGGMTETALLLVEFYRRNGTWKIRTVGQGFNGGLSVLATHLGVVIDAPAAVASTPEKPAGKVRLEKKLVDLEKRDPGLVSLVKKVQISLEKKGITRDRAKVCLCLDISGSMDKLYRSGKIDTLVRRVMALGYRFDDDGEIDVFLFGERAHAFGTVDIGTYAGLVRTIRDRYPLESGTRYGRAMETIRDFYRGDNPEGLPVYVMFVTDGGTDDKPKTERELRGASDEPIFWKFMGLIDKGFFAGARLEFLEKLDELTGRTVDNAHFFQLADPAAPSDEEMFDLMMVEYEDWCRAAQEKGILR